MQSFCCVCGSIPEVANIVEVDTAGHGIELTVRGVKDATKFKRAVLAMKREANRGRGHAPRIVSSEPMGTEGAPPNSMEMRSMPGSTTDTQLLQDISSQMDMQTRLLERLCLAQEQR